jgi:hypothetical protein
MVQQFGRISNPVDLSADVIATAFADHGHCVVQFDAAQAYSTEVLQNLNAICATWPDWFQVRFYGHYAGAFDASVLRHLPDVKSLALDCLTTIINEDALLDLPQLRHLSFGVFQFDRPDFLRDLTLGQLKSLSLMENRKRNFDLHALAGCHALETLFVQGHWNGIEAVTSLPKLCKVTLHSFAKAHSIAFLSDIAGLVEASLMLGGRQDLAEFSSETLETLQVLRVKGLQTLGDLIRFPKLRHLRIEDQVQVQSVDLTGLHLQRVALHNCKGLRQVLGLAGQSQLQEFYASRVALDLDGLRDFAWPASTKVVGLFSGSKVWNERAKADLAARGYAQFGSYWR